MSSQHSGDVKLYLRVAPVLHALLTDQYRVSPHFMVVYVIKLNIPIVL